MTTRVDLNEFEQANYGTDWLTGIPGLDPEMQAKVTNSVEALDVYISAAIAEIKQLREYTDACDSLIESLNATISRMSEERT